MTPADPNDASAGRGAELLDAWQATRAQTALATRLVANKDEYLATQPADIGRPVGEQMRELFVSCDPAPALLQQFDHLRPEFIAVHDIGTASSRKLLAAVAEATGLAVKKLAIRRQGYGTTLATLEFVEFATSDGLPLRLYGAEAEADPALRDGIARVLLAYSRLAVLMVGDSSGRDVSAAFKALRDDVITGPWPNRDLLLVPVAASAALAAPGGELGRGTGLTVRTTPAAVRPSDAWTFISGAWGRLRGQLAASGKVLPALSATAAVPAKAQPAPEPPASFGPAATTPPIEPLSLRPMPTLPQHSAAAIAPATAELMARYLQQLQRINGLQEAGIFETATGRSIAHSGAGAGGDLLGSVGSGLLASLTRAALRLQFGALSSEAAITLDARHLLLRPLPHHPGLMLHAVLDKEHANLTLARLQIQRLDEMFGEPASG